MPGNDALCKKPKHQQAALAGLLLPFLLPLLPLPSLPLLFHQSLRYRDLQSVHYDRYACCCHDDMAMAQNYNAHTKTAAIFSIVHAQHHRSLEYPLMESCQLQARFHLASSEGCE